MQVENWHGKTIKGYRLLERIGTGGFGAVYKADQSTIGREVAIKIILPHFANHPDFIRRFETEAQLVARLEHLHIVPLFDYWRDPDGAYLVMRWLRGGSLREALEIKPFGVEAAALLLDQIAAALTIAHRNNVIHRDIKPGNILLDEDGNAYLADFGIAKDASTRSITEVDAIIGSPDYLAPEQANGEPITARTDIYSLGVVLYEMVVGQHPFPNLNAVERLYKHLSEPLPSIIALPDDVCDGVNAVIQKATAKNPAHRYLDAMTMAAAFREAIKLRQSENLVETLTQREQDILRCLIAGMTNQQIADELVVTVSTVKWYVNQIFRKLNVRSRVQAIVRARELNLIVSANEATAFALITPTEDFRPENPYKGLQAFQVADNQDFFGREKLVQKLVVRLAEASEYARFLAVVGPSGSGKSSLVKAGLIPALWRGELKGSEKWFVVEMLPGTHPLDELEIALTRIAAKPNADLCEHLVRDERGLVRASQLILPDDKSEIVLIIDQFEEVFTLVDDEARRRHFLSLLVAAVTEPRSRLRVIITLRADFYDRPLHYPDFGELIRTRTETVLPLGAEGLEHAIAKPAERVGAVFEPGLVATIVGDVHYQPGALPLLQYALTELFERRRGRVLTREAYQAIGGTVGALAKRAEDIFMELSPDAQHITREMFLRLVTLGEGTEDTRRRTPRSELLAISEDPDMMDEIIDTFAAYRLLSLDNDPGTRSPTVEVAHEAILREWERLRLWIMDNREAIKMQQQLAHITEEWLNANKDTSFLASGLRLKQFEAWVRETTHALTPNERTYLEVSFAERARQNSVEAERQRRESTLERRSRTFLRGLVAVLLLATLGAFGLTGVAVTNANEAQTERERAEQQARIAQSRELVGYANGNLNADAELSTLLALQAVNITYAVDGMVLPEAETVLHQAVQSLRTPLRIPSATFPNDDTLYFGYSPDGLRIMYPVEDWALTGIADARTGQLLYTVPGLALSFISADNLMVTVHGTADDFKVSLWDVSSDEQAREIETIDFLIPMDFDWWDIGVDFRYIVTSSNNGPTRVRDLTTGQDVATLTESNSGLHSKPTFSPDASLIANLNADGTISIISTTTWEETARLASSSAVNRLVVFSFSADNRYLVSVNQNNSISVWDVATGQEVSNVTPGVVPRYPVLSVDGTRLAFSTPSGQLYVWDLQSQQELTSLAASRSAGTALSPDGTHVATLHSNGFVQIWDFVPGREYLTIASGNPVPDGGISVAYSPDGTRLVTGTTEGTIKVWDANTGQNVLNLDGHLGRAGAVWSLDGMVIASWDDDPRSNIQLWNATTGENLMTLSGHTDKIYAVAFSPDGTRLASSSYDQTVRIWNMASGEVLLTLDQPASSKGVAWSPDGQRIVAVTNIAPDNNAYLRVWNAQTGEIQLDIPLGNSRTGSVVFSPDGSKILVGMQETYVAYVLSAQSGEIVVTLTGHTSLVPGVAYSPDGNSIATASHDGTVRLWDADTGQEGLTLFTHGTGRISFSPDGRYLATQNLDGTTRIYLLSIPDLIALAQSRLTRTLTDAECQRYLHTETCPEAQAMN